MATTKLNIHPQVDAIIKPIVYEMTKIRITQKTNPLLNQNNEPDYVKEAKKQCVHIIYEDGEFRLATHKNAEGKLVCEACGRVINTKFDESAIQKITDCIEVINQAVLFGLLNNLCAEPLATLISIKKTLPACATLIKELNDFVKREDASADSISNLGAEYATPGTFNPITNY